jgi:hypothetical protein
MTFYKQPKSRFTLVKKNKWFYQEWGSFEGPFGWLALVSGALEHFPPFLISVVRFLGFGVLGFALLFISYLYLTATCAGEVSVDSSAASC